MFAKGKLIVSHKSKDISVCFWKCVFQWEVRNVKNVYIETTMQFNMISKLPFLHDFNNLIKFIVFYLLGQKSWSLSGSLYQMRIWLC